MFHMRQKAKAKKYLRTELALLFLVALTSLSIYLLYSIEIPQKITGVGMTLIEGGLGQVNSPVLGTIERWLLEEGGHAKAGDPVVEIRHIHHQDRLEVIRAKKDLELV